MPKSILLLGNYPPPYGGVPRLIEYLVPYLVKKGWEVHILSGGSTGVEFKNGFTVYKPTMKDLVTCLISQIPGAMSDITNVIYRKRDRRKILRQIALAVYAKKIVRNHRIKVVCAYNLLSTGFQGVSVSEGNSIPLIAYNFGEIHTNLDIIKRDEELTGLIKRIINRSSKLLSCSRHCADSYKLIGLSPDVEVIDTCVDIEKFHPGNDKSAVRKKFGISAEDKVVAFVGRMIKDMGLHTLIDAIPSVLKQESRVSFIIAGVKGDLTGKALRLSEIYKSKVFVSADIPFEELPLYYSASDIVIAPTQGDRACSSLASLEAMASGRPVIASKIGGIPEIVADRETGILIPPEEPPSLSENILHLLGDDALIKEMGEAGRKRVELFFDRDKANEKTERIFREVAGV